jgi:hypothetical protein
LQTHGKDYDFRWLEEPLLSLNFRLVFLHRTPGSFAAAREQRLQVSGKPEQYDDLSVFIPEQELMQRLVAESILPRLGLDISDNEIPRAVEKIADWMESTGGLYME